jgi:hypothetical protein
MDLTTARQQNCKFSVASTQVKLYCCCAEQQQSTTESDVKDSGAQEFFSPGGSALQYKAGL